MATNSSPPAPPSLVNTTAEELDNFLKNLENAMSPAIQAATIAAIDAAAPGLAVPVISTIVDAAVGAAESAVENFVTKQVELGATFIVIDVQTTQEAQSIAQADQDLEQAEASGDSNAIAAAEQEVANAQSALSRDDGSTTPQ
jgi:hypothetical protein